MSAPDATRPLDGLNILVVEDETMLFFLAEDMLLELGCAKVWHAGRLSDAVAFLAGNRPDAAMLDVNLAGEPVYPLAVKLACRRRSIRLRDRLRSGGNPGGMGDATGGAEALQLSDARGSLRQSAVALDPLRSCPG